MANSNSLILKFGTLNGEKTWTFSEIVAEPTVQQVKTLVETMITNGSIYKYPPLTHVSAKVRQVTETDYDIDDA